MKKIHVSFILTTYNEKKNIIRLVEQLDQVISCPHEIIVVDDASPDGTAFCVREIIPIKPHVRLISREERGLTSALQRGIDESQGEILVWMDVDFSMPPSKVPELLEALSTQDVVVGSRLIQARMIKEIMRQDFFQFIHMGFSWLLNFFIKKMSGISFNDWTSGFIAVKASVIKAIPLEGIYGEYFICLVAGLYSRGYRIIEIPYFWEPRMYGKSKTTLNFFVFIKQGFRYLKAVFKILRKIRQN